MVFRSGSRDHKRINPRGRGQSRWAITMHQFLPREDTGQRKGRQRELSNPTELTVRLRVQKQGSHWVGFVWENTTEGAAQRGSSKVSRGIPGVWLSTDLHRLVKSLQRPRKEPAKKSRKKKTHEGIMPSIFTSFIKTITYRSKALYKLQVEETWRKPH